MIIHCFSIKYLECTLYYSPIQWDCPRILCTCETIGEVTAHSYHTLLSDTILHMFMTISSPFLT